MEMREPEKSPELPLYLRRAPALASTGLSLLLGVGMLLAAAAVNEHHHFASDLLVNIGSAVVLFSPLALLTALFGQKIARSDIARETQISELSTQVADVRRDVDTVLADISQGSLRRLAADRQEAEQDIADIALAPESRAIASAIRHGIERGYISKRGPRTRIRDTTGFVRWTNIPESDDLRIVIEGSGGQHVGSFDWSTNQAADEFGYSLGALLQREGAYPGDIAFDVGRLFHELHELVDLGYRSTTGAGGLTNPIGPIVELTGEDWALTDFWLTTREWPQYQITLDRLDEMDWDTHIRGKQGSDIIGFRMAFDDAKDLIAQGNLAIPNYEHGFVNRMM
jgi:hypothetical protein